MRTRMFNTRGQVLDEREGDRAEVLIATLLGLRYVPEMFEGVPAAQNMSIYVVSDWYYVLQDNLTGAMFTILVDEDE